MPEPVRKLPPDVEGRKYVTVNTNGAIKELGYIGGPIDYPCNMSEKMVKKLVNAEHNVYKVDPNSLERTKLEKTDVEGIED